MEIYLMQHGQAYTEERDPQRRLTPQGEAQIRSSSQALKKLNIRFDLIVTSTKRRAQQTAQLVARELNYPEEEIKITDALDPTMPGEDAISYLKAFPDKGCILLLGHLPSLGKIASHLLSEKGEVSIYFEMGGVCRIDVDQLPSHSGSLRWYLTPAHLQLLSQ